MVQTTSISFFIIFFFINLGKICVVPTATFSNAQHYYKELRKCLGPKQAQIHNDTQLGSKG